MVMPYTVGSGLALILLVSLTATRTADGQIPTAADSVACNEEAPKAVKAGTASPTMADRARAESTRADATTTNALPVTGKLIESSDPRIHGMNAEAAKDAAYQAAYRSCMRRKGF